MKKLIIGIVFTVLFLDCSGSANLSIKDTLMDTMDQLVDKMKEIFHDMTDLTGLTTYSTDEVAAEDEQNLLLAGIGAAVGDLLSDNCAQTYADSSDVNKGLYISSVSVIPKGGCKSSTFGGETTNEVIPYLQEQYAAAGAAITNVKGCSEFATEMQKLTTLDVQSEAQETALINKDSTYILLANPDNILTEVVNSLNTNMTAYGYSTDQIASTKAGDFNEYGDEIVPIQRALSWLATNTVVENAYAEDEGSKGGTHTDTLNNLKTCLANLGEFVFKDGGAKNVTIVDTVALVNSTLAGYGIEGSTTTDVIKMPDVTGVSPILHSMNCTFGKGSDDLGTTCATINTTMMPSEGSTSTSK